MARARPAPDPAAAAKIDARIAELGGWRGRTLARIRRLILAADPGVAEDWKWEVPVWVHSGILCTGEAYKATVKLTFAHGAALPDPTGCFNASLTGGTRRAIDLREGHELNEGAFTALILAAIAFNRSRRG